MKNINKIDIQIIIILYFPLENRIKKLLNILLKEKNTRILLIDNTPNKVHSELLIFSDNITNINYIPLKENKGIAEAQNIGINIANKIEGITHILFLDQDSKVEYGFVQKMREEFKRISALGISISALGPTPVNQNNHKEYKKESVKPEKRGDGFYIPSLLISSGMLISMKTLSNVGLMDSSLFIDYVDFEWCYRAKSKGYFCCMTDRIQLLHKVGEKDHSILGYKILISKPIRYYYQYRNLMILAKRSYVPFNWKIKNILKLMFFLLYIPFIAPQGKQVFEYMLKGIIHGINRQ